MSLEKLLNDLSGTAELMGKQLSPVALAMMANDLKDYSPALISEALHNLRKGTKPFSLGTIILEIEALRPDGRLGADEAWAMYPHDEATSAVITNEIAEAMHIAQPLLNEGDKVGARMAFKEAYARIVAKNKNEGIAPKWFPSLGSEPSGRELVIKEAVRLGRLPQSTITTLLPPPLDQKFTSNVIALKQALQIQDKASPDQVEKNKARIADIKSMLAKG
jgi:hypothetical protein